MCENKFCSEIILKLKNEIINGSKDAVERFWEKIYKMGTPLIESIKGDYDNVLLTYIYKGDETTKNIVVMHPTCWKDYKDNMLINIHGTNIWYKSYIMRNDTRGRYDFSVNDLLDDDWEKRSNNIRHDILNKNKIIFRDKEGNEESMVSYFVMPEAEDYKWTIERNNFNKGSIETHKLSLKQLDEQREIYVYKPYNYSKNNIYKLLVLTDGDAYVNILSAKNVFDNLIDAEVCQPMIVVLIEEGKNRNEELMCNKSFGECLVKEIMPWIKYNFSVSDKAEDTIIGGFSLGGLFAAFIGIQYPNIFGNVISQSGSFFWSPNAPKEINWILKKYQEAKVVPTKVYINIGVLESMDYPPYLNGIDTNKKMRDILLQKEKCIVKYEEFKSGHDYLSWGETLSSALIFLLGNDDT